MSPRTPSASSRRSSRMCGRKRAHIASMRNRPDERASATSSSASPASIVNGFSTSAGLPARSASSVSSWCIGCGVATYTTSTSGSATSAS